MKMLDAAIWAGIAVFGYAFLMLAVSVAPAKGSYRVAGTMVPGEGWACR